MFLSSQICHCVPSFNYANMKVSWVQFNGIELHMINSLAPICHLPDNQCWETVTWNRSPQSAEILLFAFIWTARKKKEKHLMMKARKVAKSPWGGTRPSLPASSLQVIYFQESEGRPSSQAK